jgi:hypothetical protein
MGSYTFYVMSKSHSNCEGVYGTNDPFNANTVKSNVLVMGTCELNGETLYSW